MEVLREAQWCGNCKRRHNQSGCIIACIWEEDNTDTRPTPPQEIERLVDEIIKLSGAINEDGWTLEEAQKWGGWTSILTLQNHYGDYEIERLRQLQNRVIPIRRQEEG
jgi:hypothetical protein